MEKRVFKLNEALEIEDFSRKKAGKEDILDDVKDKLEKERTRSLSIKEGSACSVMSGFTSDYVTPFALVLQANNFQIGLLNSVSGLVPPLAQIYGSKLIEKYSRKRIITMFVALQALMWLPIAFLSLLLWRSLIIDYLPWLLIAFYTIYAVFGAIAGPAWFSLMGDIVPEHIRGKYFGKRNRICGAVTIICALVASFFLDYFKTHGYVLLGFSILFSLACIFRLISANYFKKHYDPKFKLEKRSYFSLWQFTKKAPFNNFGKFVIFVSLFYIGVNVGGIFFSVYMLRTLGFSYTTLVLVNISASVFSILFMPIWGKFADKYGNRELIKIGAFLVGVMPVFWVFSPNPIYLILVPQLISGIGWAAFNLGSSNFIYDCATPQKRPLCVSYYNIIVGVGVFIGANAGGLLANFVKISFLSSFLVLFLLSAVLRLLVSLIMIPKIKEVRKVKKTGTGFFTYLKEIAPLSGLVSEIFGDVKVIEKEIKIAEKEIKKSKPIY